MCSWVLTAAASVAAVLLLGCASKPLNVPSGTAVTSGLGNIGTSVSDAKKYNDLAVVHNAGAMTRVQRIDAKAKVLQRYWK